MARLDIGTDSPAGLAALVRLDTVVSDSLGPRLFNLVKLRASQLNGCGYCVDSHATALESLGVDHRTLNGVAAWRHTAFFDDEEKVALEFTEALTGGIDTIDDTLWQRAGEVLGVRRRADLVLAVGVIGTWNMIGLAGELIAQ